MMMKIVLLRSSSEDMGMREILNGIWVLLPLAPSGSLWLSPSLSVWAELWVPVAACSCQLWAWQGCNYNILARHFNRPIVLFVKSPNMAFQSFGGQRNPNYRVLTRRRHWITQLKLIRRFRRRDWRAAGGLFLVDGAAETTEMRSF